MNFSSNSVYEDVNTYLLYEDIFQLTMKHYYNFCLFFFFFFKGTLFYAEYMKLM